MWGIVAEAMWMGPFRRCGSGRVARGAATHVMTGRGASLLGRARRCRVESPRTRPPYARSSERWCLGLVAKLEILTLGCRAS
jgi:hypothetical protein